MTKSIITHFSIQKAYEHPSQNMAAYDEPLVNRYVPYYTVKLNACRL